MTWRFIRRRLGPDYHRLKTMVKRSIEQDIRNKNFGARNGNYEKNAVVKNQGTKQRVQRILGDCWQWEFNGQCSRGDNCSFRHDMNNRGKMSPSNPSPNSFMQQNERKSSRTRSPRGRSPSGRMSRWPCAEAEFCAAVKAAAAVIGCLSMMRDLGVMLRATRSRESKRKGWVMEVDSPSLEIKLDATSGRAIAMRRGAGRIRHNQTPTLWLQRLVINGDIKMTRVGGSDNCADLGTKDFDYQTMIRHLKFCGMRLAEGRSRIAPQLEHLSTIDSDEH